MIEKANLAGKSFITSSQLLESMELNSVPSRAEVSDVSNAVLDGTDYIMLSSKTSNGKYLLESLKLLSSCCLEVEKMIEFKVLNHHSDTIEQIMADPETAEQASKPP